MSGAESGLTTEELLLKRQDDLAKRQDAQFSEIKSELKELAGITKGNALDMRDLISALKESSIESRHTREHVDSLEAKVKEIEIEQDAQGNLLREKRSNQKLILTIYSTILAAIFTFFGWLFGKS